MTDDRQKHRWIGWGWDETICEHCRKNVYYPFTVKGEYCDEYDAEKAAWELELESRPMRLKKALSAARNYFTEDEWQLLRLNYFEPYSGS
jgi:hypothetical protein